MNINEIFYSIQGEGQWTGLPNIFIRTQGCNLRCTYCDTKYAYEKGKKIPINLIIKKISEYPCKHVCITGGEPLLQTETQKLIDVLAKKGYKICLETNGSIPLNSSISKKNLIISMDIKCPSSKMNEKNNFKNIEKLEKKDQLKFVIKDKKDYEYAKKILSKHKPKCSIFFQPVWGFKPQILAEWIIRDGLNVKLGLQIHKILWKEKKGC